MAAVAEAVQKVINPENFVSLVEPDCVILVSARSETKKISRTWPILKSAQSFSQPRPIS